MVNEIKELTGESCPFCGKGKLYLTSHGGYLEYVPRPEQGLHQKADIEYRCDVCGKTTRSVGIGLNDTAHATESVSITKYDENGKIIP